MDCRRAVQRLHEFRSSRFSSREGRDLARAVHRHPTPYYPPLLPLSFPSPAPPLALLLSVTLRAWCCWPALQHETRADRHMSCETRESGQARREAEAQAERGAGPGSAPGEALRMEGGAASTRSRGLVLLSLCPFPSVKICCACRRPKVTLQLCAVCRKSLCSSRKSRCSRPNAARTWRKRIHT